MALILNIDTATEKATISIARDGNNIAFMNNDHQKDHASWLHTTIKDLLKENELKLSDLQAIAVTAGPGSYTGLRVGMAAAKGLCYALRVPLITEITLCVMAHAARTWYDTNNIDLHNVLYCPMLDARRMEVFTAAYSPDLNEVLSPRAMILEQDSFQEQINMHQVLFFGSGSIKWKDISINTNAGFADIQHSSADLAALSEIKFQSQHFSDPAYSEPVYLKEFYTHQPK